MTKKEKLYVVGQFCVSVTGTSIFQMAYNEPSFILERPEREIIFLAGCIFTLAVTNTIVTWLGYLSDPNETKLKIASPGEKPPTQSEMEQKKQKENETPK